MPASCSLLILFTLLLFPVDTASPAILLIFSVSASWPSHALYQLASKWVECHFCSLALLNYPLFFLPEKMSALNLMAPDNHTYTLVVGIILQHLGHSPCSWNVLASNITVTLSNTTLFITLSDCYIKGWCALPPVVNLSYLYSWSHAFSLSQAYSNNFPLNNFSINSSFIFFSFL